MKMRRPSVCWLVIWLACGVTAAADLPELIRTVKPAVVSIVAYDPAKALPGTGTGWLIGPDRMVTCRHVLGGCDRAEIRLADGRYAKIVGLLAEERNWDLALCALDRSFIDVTPLATTAALPAEGETVLLIGGPLGLEWTSSVGIISALRELPTLGTVLQHTAAISPGNSGGPVFNVQGQVVGMQTSTITTDNKVVAAGQGLNFAVPASYIQALRAGPMRSLADCAKEVPGDWRASSTALLDKCSLRPFSRGDFEGALGYFEESTRRDPDVADVWLRMAICHEKLGNLDRAGECYLRATKIDPTLAIAFNNLGVVSFRQKRTDEAIGYLNKALSLKPDMALAYSNLADCFNSLGRYDDALAACQKGLSFDGRHANLRYALGITYLNLGHKSLAGEQARLLDTLDKAQADRLRQEIAKNGT